MLKYPRKPLNKPVSGSPPWIIRRGNMLVAAAITASLALAYFIRIPITIPANCVMQFNQKDSTIDIVGHIRAIGISSVKVGQRVSISLSYDYSNSFGVVEGWVASMPVFVAPEEYIFKIQPADNRELVYKMLMFPVLKIEGSGKVILRNKRALERMLGL